MGNRTLGTKEHGGKVQNTEAGSKPHKELLLNPLVTLWSFLYGSLLEISA